MTICTSEFVQIGQYAFRLSSIAYVEFGAEGTSLCIFFIGGLDSDRDTGLILTGAFANRFKDWWTHHASVWVIE